MLSIRNGEEFARALRAPIDPDIKALLKIRLEQLRECDLPETAHIGVVEHGDDDQTATAALGFSIFTNQVDGSRFGECDFCPSAEWIADHGFCFEAVFIFDDSGFAHVLIVPKQPFIDQRILAFCEQFSLSAA